MTLKKSSSGEHHEPTPSLSKLKQPIEIKDFWDAPDKESSPKHNTNKKPANILEQIKRQQIVFGVSAIIAGISAIAILHNNSSQNQKEYWLQPTRMQLTTPGFVLGFRDLGDTVVFKVVNDVAEVIEISTNKDMLPNQGNNLDPNNLEFNTSTGTIALKQVR